MKHASATMRWGSVEQKIALLRSTIDYLLRDSSYRVPDSAEQGFFSAIAGISCTDGILVRGLVAETMAFTICPSLPYAANGRLMDMLLLSNRARVHIWLADSSENVVADLYSGYLEKKY